ncbi:MAG: hypothetical protein RQ801_00130 [Spirochaetaceae bacterium]|nr:hypothetical protein [Spirochaetaceae bacterium]MDT8296675.1 hypothetical protein [Spirochaetaceae bacterium]
MNKEKYSDPANANSSVSNEKAEEQEPKKNNDMESCEVCGTEVVSWKTDHNSGIRLVIR